MPKQGLSDIGPKPVRGSWVLNDATSGTKMIELFYAQIKGAAHRDELWSAWIGFDGVIKCMERTQHPLLEESFDRYEELLPHLLEEPEELLAYINHQSHEALSY